VVKKITDKAARQAWWASLTFEQKQEYLAKQSRKQRQPLTAEQRAEREAARNKALIDAGETFAGHKPSDWRRGRRGTTRGWQGQ
jgi:hypothetical protein